MTSEDSCMIGTDLMVYHVVDIDDDGDDDQSYLQKLEKYRFQIMKL
jgi:hypothetical protein